MHVLGLMSGTSADGVDAVLAEFEGCPNHPKWTLLNLVSVSYPASLSKKVINAGQGEKLTSKEWLELTEAITEIHAQAALICDRAGKAELVGCHGQTVWHRPPHKQQRGATWQLIHGTLLAHLIKKPVIHDFRSADLVLGGQGAPLVPMTDCALLGKVGGWRAVLNLGGISNLTLIPPRCGPDRSFPVMGWDCGPANSLIDLAMQKLSNGELAFDRDGLIATSGLPDEVVIARWLEESFFQKAPPKSTGREFFGLADLEKRLNEMPFLSSANVIATITAFSAAIIAQDLRNFAEKYSAKPIELIVAGGGCRNRAMLKEIIDRCLGMRVIPIQEMGIAIEGREALAFALLAWWHSLKYPGNSPAITGAKRPAVLGVRVEPK